MAYKDFTMLGNKITDEQTRLDKFNFDVAEYRIQNGMSEKLKTLYRDMGVYGEELDKLKRRADNLNALFSDIVFPKKENML